MRKFAGMPDDAILALLRDCNPRTSVDPQRPAYQAALELNLVKVVDSQAPLVVDGAEQPGLDYIVRTDDGRDYLLWARSFESVG